jgi:hypothetical protein
MTSGSWRNNVRNEERRGRLPAHDVALHENNRDREPSMGASIPDRSIERLGIASHRVLATTVRRQPA